MSRSEEIQKEIRKKKKAISQEILKDPQAQALLDHAAGLKHTS